MDLGLSGKSCLVTGGTSGIGLATARLLLSSGAQVAICGRDAGRLAAAEDALTAEFGAERVLARQADVRDAAAMRALAEAVAQRFGGCDLLVNNAGQGRVSTFAETDDAAWRDELELKFFSQIHPVRAFLPLLRAAHGAVVVVNSLLALQPEPHMVCTSAARAGVQSLVKSLSVELAPQVRVNAILLGLVDSAQWQRRFAARDDLGQTAEAWYGALAARKGIPLGRLGQPDEAARAIAFLGAPAASYITGASLEVSGGLSRHI
ncbi:MAG: SDR family oxidoreductase [Pseudomonadota bacterium]